MQEPEHFSLRDTVNNIDHMSNLRAAIDKLRSGDLSPVAFAECVATVELAFHIMEHKAIRINELESQIETLKSAGQHKAGDLSRNDLINELAMLETKYEQAQKTIHLLEDLCLQQETLTDTGT